MDEGPDPEWSHWKLSQWNDALVDAVFTKRSDTSFEIVRIDATNRLLVSAVAGSPNSAEEIRQTFLNSFPKTRSPLSRLFDAPSQTRNWHYHEPLAKLLV